SLFSERGARAIVSIAPENLAAVLSIARQYGVAAREIGKVTPGDAFRIEHKGCAVIDSPVESLRDAWASSLEFAVKGSTWKEREEFYQEAATRKQNCSNTTRVLVVFYHFFLAGALTAALVAFWIATGSSREEILTPQEVALVIVPIVLVYLLTGWGMLKWKN